MKTLNIMDLSFNYKAAIRGYESAVLTRAWNGIGNLALKISAGIPNSNLIAVDDIVWFNNDYHKAFIVEKIETTLEGSNKVYSITASSINGLLKDFITIPPAAQDFDSRTGTRESVARAWVTQNCISPTDMTRAQYPIILGTYKILGGTITEQTRLKVLSDEIIRILTTEDLGWGLVLDIPNHRFIFNIYLI